MINKKLYKTVWVITLVYLTAMTFYQNPMKENYSMLSSSLLGYLAVFGLCILLSLSFLFPVLSLNRKYWYLALGPIVGCLFPYTAFKGDILSNVHEVCAYISFGMCVLLTVLNIYRYIEKSFRKGKRIMNIFIVVFFLDGILYLETMGVVGIEEFILLSVMIVINAYMYLEINNERIE